MNRRVEIVVSTKPPGMPAAARPLGFWRRFKMTLLALGLASLAFGVLIFLIVVGSIIAAVLWTVLVLAIVWAILRAAFLKAKSRRL